MKLPGYEFPHSSFLSIEKDLEIIKYKSKVSNPKDLKVLDPCMGSGHMLLYVFDVLIQIYESKGYTKKDAAILILENNIFGLLSERLKLS